MKGFRLATLLCGLISPTFAGDIADIIKSGDIWKKTYKELSGREFSDVSYDRIDADTIRISRR